MLVCLAPTDMFDAICVPSIADGTKSAKYAITAVTKAISSVMASIINTLWIWPKACDQAAALLAF